MPRRTMPKETAARKLIDQRLLHLGWNTDEQNPHCDVVTERPKLVSQQEALGGFAPDYVVYAPGTDDPIAIIEAKKPGYTLEQAINQAIEKYAKPLCVNIVFATDGNLCESHDIRHNGPLLLDSEPVVDLLPPRLLLRFVSDGPSLHTPTPNQQTKQELIGIFDKANDLLRREGLRHGVERFSEFANLLFLKLISEIEDEREASGLSRRLAERFCWTAFATKPKDEMMDHINDTVLPKLVRDYNHSSEVFESRLRITSAETLKDLVDRLSELSLLDTDSDIKGDAFEYFLKHSISVGNDLGEYFTPRHIVRLIVDLIDPRYGETVYDPCCGTGGFLIQAFRHIAAKITDTPEHRDVLENHTIFGCELTGTARIAKMNMILAGDGHTNIVQQDALAHPARSAYDVVLTNFPFSQETEYGSEYSAPTKDANPVFLRHVVEAAREDGGRIGVVVPEGVLFGEQTEYRRARKYLVDNCTVEAVIALHSFVFRPYTGQPTAILILTRGGAKKPVWFFEVSEDGFEKTTSRKGRPAISGENDLLSLRSLWTDRQDTEHSMAVPLKRIKENGYKLSYSSYRPRDEQKDWKPLGDVCDIKLGATPATKEATYWRDGTEPWAKITDMTAGGRYVTTTEKKITQKAVRETSVKLLPRGTILLSYKLSIGKTAIAGRSLYTNEAIAGIVPKNPNDVLPEYLYYLLPCLNIEDYAQPAAKGHTLNKGILEKIRIPVPPPTEQTRFIEAMKEHESSAISWREQAADADREQRDEADRFIAEQT